MTTYGYIKEKCPRCGQFYLSRRCTSTSSWSYYPEISDKLYDLCYKCGCVWKPKAIGTSYTEKEATNLGYWVEMRIKYGDYTLPYLYEFENDYEYYGVS